MIKNYFGSKNTILFGFTLMTVTTFGLGAIANINDTDAFKYSGLALRFFQGQGDILLQITCYTVVCNTFSDQIMKYITMIEITVGLGLGLGPTLGSIVYAQLEYEKTMYMFGGINTIGILICCCLLPNELNKTVKEEDVAAFEAEMEDLLRYDIDENKKQSNKIRITSWTVYCNRHCFFALMVIFFGCYNTTFFTGFIGNNLTYLGLESQYVGYAYGAQSATYLIGAILLPYTCEHLSRKVMFVLSILGFGADMFLLGPSQVLNLPNQWYYVVAAFPILGLC